MIHATCIPNNEIEEWLHDHTDVVKYITQAYKSCIPNMVDPISFDPRFLINDHIVNPGFNEDPIFLLGYNKSTHLILGVLYVFERYRNKGIASYLIESFKIQYGGLIQVAVAGSSNKLNGFYKKRGFKTTDVSKKDVLGTEFVDYFWSPKPINLTSKEHGTIVSPII